MTKRIVLCADDYGQAPAISQGIVSLLEKGRLSATSCLVTGSNWQEHADRLRPFLPQADIGLHLNLTEGKPLSQAFTKAYGDSFFSLPVLMSRAVLGQLDQSVLEAEFSAQLDRFSEKMGSLPRFLDGHQHVHQFSVVRDAVFAIYDRDLRKNQSYIRWVNPKKYPLDFIRDLKKSIICMMGTAVFGHELRKRNIPHNTSFAGIYGFKGPYAAQFPRFLEELTQDGILMCHPALGTSGDVIGIAREEEYQYLASKQFEDDCDQFQVKISCFG